MQKNIRRRRRLYEVVADAVELPADAVSNIPVFTVRGYHEMEADGCDGILEYDERRVMLSVSGRRVTVVGESLTLSDFRDGTLFVRGNIHAVYLTEDGICSVE